MPVPSNRMSGSPLYTKPCPNKRKCSHNRRNGEIFCHSCYWQLPEKMRGWLYTKDLARLPSIITLCLEELNPHDEREDP